MRRFLLALFVLIACSAAFAAPAKCYDWIVKERIRGGYLSAANLGTGQARMKAVGMNLLLPKFGGLQYPPTEDNVTLLRQWGAAAKTNGLHLMPVFNLRGGETEKILSDRREMAANGVAMTRTPCPLDEAFWTRYIVGRMVYLAEHAKEQGLDGGILDPEMYGADHTCFTGVCYCTDCLREFLLTVGKALPDPLPAERAEWLKAQGLSDKFEQYFVSRVEGFGRRLEQEVHAKNADFVIGVLLLDYPLLYQKGLAKGMGTVTHPVLAFSESTYSPGYTDYVEQQPKTFAAMPAQVLFVPGLWQQQFPTENLAEQYYTCAARSSGYWIYTFESLLEDVSKLPGYQLREPGDRYWESMKTANGELDKLALDPKYASALTVRPFDPPLPVVGTADIPIQTLIPAPDDKPVSLGPVTQPRLRYRNPLAILGKAGEPLTLRITNLQLANYRPGTQWVLVGPDGTRLQEGHFKVRESNEVSYTPTLDGVHLLVVESGQNSHRLEVLSGQPNAYLATPKQPLTVNGQFGRLYFYVPKGTGKFTFSVKADGQAAGRGGKLTVYGPDAKAAGHLEGDLGSWTELPVEVSAEGQGRVWCLAVEDVSNDLQVNFSDNMPEYFSTDPMKVLATKP